MKNQKRILHPLFIFLFLLLPGLSYSQGILIEVGAKIEIEGAATIEIIDGGLINNGTYITGSETVNFSGTTLGEISGTSATIINDLRITNTGGVTFEIGSAVTEIVEVDESSTFVIEKGSEIAVSGKIKLKSKGKKRGQYFNNVIGREDSIEQECFFEGGQWTFFAPPVDMLASDVFPSLSLATEGFSDADADYWLAEYSQNDRANTGSGMTDISSNSAPLKRGQGYMVWVDVDQTGVYSYLSTDAPNTIDATVSNTQAINNSGWNLVGNPFTYTFTYDDIFDCAYNAAHFMGAVYVWDGVGYIEWVNGLGDIEAQTISPLEAFFVKLDRADGVADGTTTSGFCMERGTCTCTATETKSAHVSTKTVSSVDALTIVVEANGKSDKTYIRVHSEATLGFDSKWDAHKIELINSDKPIVYSTDDEDLAYGVNAIPVEATVEEIPLQINLSEASSTVQLSFEIQGDASYEYTLYDRQAGTLTSIVGGQGMSITTNGETSIADRLFVQVGNADNEGVPTILEAEDKTTQYADVYNTNGGLCAVAYFDKVRLDVYDISGNRILRKVLYANEEVTINLSPNFYLVKTSLGDDAVTQKMVVK